MRIIVHPKVAAFKRLDFLKGFGLEEFAKAEFLREDIPYGERFLGLVHSKRHIRRVKRACEVRAEMAEMKLSPDCYEVACLSVGTVVLASHECGFAVQCMTGHHANRENAMGFNLFNSIAIAAKRLVNRNERVCIIDIDGHHGNGIQSIFYGSDSVFYCSVHEDGVFPGTGYKNEAGRGNGTDYTLNISLSKNSGDDALLAALKEVIGRTGDFRPDIVGVYAGFDGYHSDDLLDLNYTVSGFNAAGKMIGGSFKRVFAVLGGGYHKDVAKCAFAFVDGINGEQYPRG